MGKDPHIYQRSGFIPAHVVAEGKTDNLYTSQAF